MVSSVIGTAGVERYVKDLHATASAGATVKVPHRSVRVAGSGRPRATRDLSTDNLPFKKHVQLCRIAKKAFWR